MRGLYVGRFQPLHEGHLACIRYSLERVDDLIIGIGSCGQYRLPNNPFTVGERMEMILASVPDRRRIMLSQIPDANDYSHWFEVVERSCPHFDVVFTSSDLTAELAGAAGYRVERLPHVSREELSGKRIRDLMFHGKDVSSLVPGGCLEVLDGMDGTSIIREAMDRRFAPIGDISHELHRALLERNLTVSVAESCTGGLFSASLVDNPGSSRYFKGGMVVYSNGSKVDLAGVDPDLLDRYGAVSEEVAGAMAKGAMERFSADVGIGITGIAGPDGGTREKPVGTVFVSISGEFSGTERLRLRGDRTSIRCGTVKAVRKMLLEMLL